MEKRGQIWVETVIYILIALVMIGAVLTFAQPKIEEIQDKLTLDKTFEMLEGIDSQILSVYNGGSGNKRVISLEIKKGKMIVYPDSDEIQFILEESKSMYSEPNENEFYRDGNVFIKTTEVGDNYKVILKLDYKDIYDIQTEDGTNLEMAKSSSKYELTIANKGGKVIEIKKV